MQMYKLDLTNYEIEIPVVIADTITDETQKIPFDVRTNLSGLLRSAGMFEDPTSLIDAVLLARDIVDIETDTIDLTENELELLQHVINRGVKQTFEGQFNLGGPNHEELIIRVMTLEKSDAKRNKGTQIIRKAAKKRKKQSIRSKNIPVKDRPIPENGEEAEA
jgi:hypothetical protein